MARRPLLPAGILLVAASLSAESARIRDLGIEPGVLPAGPLNAITDVSGVAVGHKTLVEGDSIRTGVTAVLPHGENVFQNKVRAAVWVANAFGKAAGFLQVRELGTIETPIVLTNTLSVGTAVEAVVRWTLRQEGNEEVRSVNAVAGETNDGYLNDIRRRVVTDAHVVQAIEGASAGPVTEGAVGAGTGTIAFGWKGGIGTSSRQLPESLGGYTVGVLTQSNFGGILTIDGLKVGERLGRHSLRRELEQADGSCMIILATDAPLSSRSLERLARRTPLGLARAGSFIGNGSGDFVIAFSTADRIPHRSESPTQEAPELRSDRLSALFLAAVEATEEAVYNSMTAAESMVGHLDHRIEELPLSVLREMHAARSATTAGTRVEG